MEDECGEEIIGYLFTDKAVLTDTCCIELVAVGKACQLAMVKMALSLPAFKPYASLVLPRSQQLWNRCVAASHAAPVSLYENFNSAERNSIWTRLFNVIGLVMGISKTEVNLRRLLAAAPKQQNQAKLVHYVATLREQLEQLAEERTPEGLPRVSKALVTDYSEKIEAIASKLTATVTDLDVPQESLAKISVKGSPSKMQGESHFPPSPGLRRRSVPASGIEDKTHETLEDDSSAPVKLDAAAQAHIEKHRKLQDDLTDEMVGLARQLKESSLMMSRSVQDTEKILDSTEEAVERSLASTGHANSRASEIYSKTSKTTCFTWLLIFLMSCIFIMVVLLIRVT
ncbi:hypothetical protein FNV43_RR03316 [Rhamnella rubrinervis]|uniref:Prolamin-like domain-containing protein n=1 Tax=Rhamnella rubrinervis TaxID=2594499 RepID=A0A8K0HIX7_9ROSA|nr:hypothetical protein FNV43_RR03316 [Rhamnella rubrinervis]